MGALRPCPEESVDFENTKNIYIEGDNLEVLKLLQVAYFHKVKMIYIDPPYNTGHDFVYEDDYSDPMERYKAVTSQATKSNPETMGRFHTKWLNMMYPRLKLASYLLRDDGVIFISIDDVELFNLKKICDEVFGEENFLALLTRRGMHTVRNSSKDFNKNSDYILVYAKNKSIIENDKNKWIRAKVDKSDNYKLNDNDGKGFYKLDPIYARNYAKPYIYKFKNGIEWQAPKGSYPRYSEETLKYKEENNELNFDGKEPRAKRYLNEVQVGQPPDTYMREENVGFNSDGTKDLANSIEKDKIFSQPKPVKLIKYLISLLSYDKDDIILDFFSGSATTAHAVMQLNAEDGGNRQFIMVQLPELCDEKSEAYKAGYNNICEIGKERIRRAGKKILDENNQLKLDERENPLDVGFKVFKLDTSNLNEWNSITKRMSENSDTEILQKKLELMLNKIKPDRSDLDVVYEVVLKLGFPLSTWIGTKEISGKKCFIVSEECLIIICLEQGLTFTDIQRMAEYKPVNLIFSKHSFADSNTLINAHYKIRDIGIEIKLI